jgi:hypothetical protein
MEERKIYEFGDKVLVSLLKMLQLAMLTQSDVTDNFRLIRVEASPSGKLEPTPEFNEWFESQITQLLTTAQAMEEESRKNAS